MEFCLLQKEWKFICSIRTAYVEADECMRAHVYNLSVLTLLLQISWNPSQNVDRVTFNVAGFCFSSA